MFGKISFFGSTKPRTSPDSGQSQPMKYCPECGDEFRPEFDECAVCTRALVSRDSDKSRDRLIHKKQSGRNLKIMPGDELVTVRRGNLLEIKEVQRLLKDEIIGSLLVEDRSGGASGCCNAKSFELRVKKEHVGDVQDILMDDFKRSTALDSHDFHGEPETIFDQRLSEAQCPACGSSFITTLRQCPECGLCF